MLKAVLEKCVLKTNSRFGLCWNKYCNNVIIVKRNMEFKYPEARRDETVVDMYHGREIADPYRWLEDPDSDETKAYIQQLNNLTRPYLNSCQYRDDVRLRLQELWNFERTSCPERQGDQYFVYRNTGLQNQSVLYVQKSLDDEPRVFYDPNELSDDGTVALADASFSEDGSLLAYALSESGSDWSTIQFMDVASGETFPDVLRKVKFSQIAWTHDNLGVFYCCYPGVEQADGAATANVEHHKLFYHLVGTGQEYDVCVAEFPEDPLLRINVDVTDCGKWLVMTPRRGCKSNLLYCCCLEGRRINKPLPFTLIVGELRYDYEYVTSFDSMHVFRTNNRASNYRLVGINFEDVKAPWIDVVPQHETQVLDWAAPVNNTQLLICYVKDAVNILQLFSSTGVLLYTFPINLGTIVGYSGKKKHTEIFYKFVSFLTPGIIYRCSLNEPLILPEVYHITTVANFNFDRFETRQVFFQSKDSTRVPMFIVAERDLELNGTRPCLLYGYGGFNISIQPTFSVTRLVFIQHLRGVLAVANIRGGGEYGDRWHNAGRQSHKQNTFDDFQSAAEYLTEHMYTSRELLTIQGGSNGGLLIAACINQRPELFGAAVIQVGVLDMLRFHKFTIGAAWSTDYGCAEVDADQFETLVKYSPLHNVQAPTRDGRSQYPATLLLTADHDDRVVPLHSLKFIAQLHHTAGRAPEQHNPLLIRVECKAGHGIGKPTTKIIDEATDILCFIIKSLELQFQR